MSDTSHSPPLSPRWRNLTEMIISCDIEGHAWSWMMLAVESIGAILLLITSLPPPAQIGSTGLYTPALLRKPKFDGTPTEGRQQRLELPSRSWQLEVCGGQQPVTILLGCLHIAREKELGISVRNMAFICSYWHAPTCRYWWPCLLIAYQCS
jgi:hypothetical protein